ncbi:MAG: hypothetical protein FH758_02900 [Firmicutes bacterium]|nr:hypothetical protein [Bacillota bacterium]
MIFFGTLLMVIGISMIIGYYGYLIKKHSKDPDNELIKRINLEMTETFMDKHEHNRKTESKYDGVIEYYSYNEPIDFPEI